MDFDKLASRLRRLDTRSSPAVIFGCGSTNGLAFVRSLGSKGISTIAINGGQSPAMRSRYALNLTHPGGTDPGTQLLQLLQYIGEQLPNRGVILPTSDSYVLFLSRNREALSPYFHFVIPDESTLEQMANKRLQVEYAESIGIPVPRTHIANTIDDLNSMPESFIYPGILKPVYSHMWRRYVAESKIRTWEKVLEVDSFDHLHDELSKVSDSGLDFMVQEKIEGGDDQLYALYAYFDRTSVPLVTFIRKKLRQWPVEFGVGCYSESVANEDVENLGVRLLTSIGYQGLSNTEFKWDPNDDRYKLIEVNVRCAGQTALAVDSGADIPYVAYLDALGKAQPQQTPYQHGIRWMNLASDYRSFRAYRKSGELSWASWVKSVVTARSHAYFSIRDIVPFLYMSAGLAKRVLRRSR